MASLRSAQIRRIPGHTAARCTDVSAADTPAIEESEMSKGMDQKKSEKKKPAKTMKEKKAEKKDKKAGKAFGV